ncbi:MAG: hypothetical protein IIA03_01660 [Proteobacteria bacterium]|nr:hypothetical protein [Pseudomonadota bacterium]
MPQRQLPLDLSGTAASALAARPLLPPAQRARLAAAGLARARLALLSGHRPQGAA